jgi:hypothetical protein
MASFPQQFQGNSSPAAGAPWNATAFPAPQHLAAVCVQSAPSSYRRPPTGQPLDHARVLQDAVVSNWHRRDTSPFTRAHTPVLF